MNRFLSELVAAMLVAILLTNTADAVFIAGFESGTQGFDATYTGTGTLSTGSGGSSEGSSALQFNTPAGAFVGTQSYALSQSDLIAAAVAGDNIFIDVSVETPNATDFATLRTGISSDKGFKESTDKPMPIDGTITTLSWNLGFSLIDGSETFAGLILAVNSKVDVPMVFRIDNIRTQPVPEPGTLALVLLGSAAVLLKRQRVSVN